MSSASPERPPQGPWARGTLALRLTLGYALLFTVSALALFALTYALLLGSVRGQDRAFARAQLRAYAAAYAEAGLPAVERAAGAIRHDDRGEEMLVRVADAANRTRLLLPPEDWTAGDLSALERLAPDEARRLLVQNARERLEVEVDTRRLPDGGVLQVGVSSDERDDVMEAFPDVFLAIALPLLVLALLGGAFMAQRALSPIRHLVHTLRAIITTGDVGRRAPAPAGRGELAELFRLFNRMLDRIEALVDRQRGTLDDVAHDLRTPMTRLRGTVELALQEGRDPERMRTALAEALGAAEAITETLDAIMDVSEAEAGAMPLRLEAVDLGLLARDVADLYALVAEEKGVALDVAPGAAVARGDRARLQRALANLVDNAVKYTPAGGRVTIRAYQEAEASHVEVRDSGAGIPAAELPRIWDRLYRGDRSRSERGLGLGLSLVRAIAEAHGGRAEVTSEADRGSTFTLSLPPA